MKCFGVIPFTDDNDIEYVVSNNNGIPDEYSYMHILPNVINQGEDPICVPCSISTWLNWKTNLKNESNIDNHIDLMDIFKNGNGTEQGMTCKGAFEYLISTYKLSKYYKISSLPALKHALIVNGPCITVLPVFNENVKSFWNKKSGNFVGYHAVSIIGYDKNGFIIRNSWGRSYGKNGYYHITNEDITKLSIEIWTLC